MTKERNPENTRQFILETTAELMSREGYQGLRVDEIVKKTGLTKGAIYHHFPNKKALSYAVIDEYHAAHFMELWEAAFSNKEDPIQGLCDALIYQAETMTEETLEVGCPVCNLGQEMAPLDEGFQQRIEAIFESWIGLMIESFSHGQEIGVVRKDINPEDTALYIVATTQGIISMGKCTQDLDKFRACIRVLVTFLHSLRP